MSRALLLLLALAALPAWAHKGSDVYWMLEARDASLTGRVDVALKDLDAALRLDADGDRRITWGELRAQAPAIGALLRSSLGLTQQGAPCALEPGALAVIQHSDGAYAAVPLTGRCPAPITSLEARYELLFELDPTHRGLLSLQGERGGHWEAFTTNRRTRAVEFISVSGLEQARLAVVEGLVHIALGWDHLCFLFALLLPSVLRREGARWAPRSGFKPTLVDVTTVVTAFTVAHSLTLVLAAFDVVTPSAKLVEVAIALSVALAALNNLVPFVPETRWSLAFSLGLMHGFGFVSALRDLGDAGPSSWLSVLGFNVGVELGQLVLVAAFVPLAWRLRGQALYVRGALPLGSALILGVALYWTAQRV